MELRHLRYFIAVALEENITKAAERLRVSQPALSRQVRDLEDELGFELLERTAKSVALTEAGRVFLEEASAVLERLEAGVKAAKAVATEGSGELHVGYAPSLTVKILPPTIRAFQAERPRVKVKLHDLSSAEMLEGLRSGRLDFALIGKLATETMPGVQFEPLKAERVRLAVPLGHPLAVGGDGTAGGLNIGAVAGEPLHGFNLREYPEYGDILKVIFDRPDGRAPRLAEEHESVASLVAAVESGMGVAVVTESLSCVASGRVALLPLTPDPPVLTIGIAWMRPRLDARQSCFLDKAKEACRGIEEPMTRP